MISTDDTADHGPNSRHTTICAACAKCAEYASQAQQWQSAYLQLERQFVQLQLRIDEVDTMSSLSRNGSMARSRTNTSTTVTSSAMAKLVVQCSDQGVGQGSVCDLINRNVQTSPEQAPVASSASTSASALIPAVADDAVQTDANPCTFATDDKELEPEEESPQSSELLTVIPPPDSSATAIESSSSSRSSSWISTVQSIVLTENHASQTSCSFLATCTSAVKDTDDLDSTPQHVARRKYRRRPPHARTSNSSTRPRTVPRRIRGLSKRPVKQRPLAAPQSDTEFVHYSDVSDHETSDDADVEHSVTLTSGSETERSRGTARSVTPTQSQVGHHREEEDNDCHDELSSRGEPLEFASDSSMSQPRPPTPPLASNRTHHLQQRQQHQHHSQTSVLATPPISPSDGSTAHSAIHTPPSPTVSSARVGSASSNASTRSLAPSSTNAYTHHSSSSISITFSDSMPSVSDPPLVNVHGPVSKSGSPLGMAAPQCGGVMTNNVDQADDKLDRKQVPLDSAPTLLSLLESPAHSFNVLTVSRGRGGGEGAPGSLERNMGQEIPTLSRGTRLEIDLSRLSTITEMSNASVSDTQAVVAKPVEASSGTQHTRQKEPPLPPMAWPKPPSTTPPPALSTSDAPLPAHVPTSHGFMSSAPVPSTCAVSRAPLVQPSPPLLAEASPVSRKKSKSKNRSNASSANQSTSKLVSLMPRRQPTDASTSSSGATVSDYGVGAAGTVASSDVSVASAAAASGDGQQPKEKNKRWKAVTSFVTKVKDKVRDKVQHKSHPSMGRNTVFAATDVHPHQSPPTSRRSSLAQLVGLSSYHHASAGSMSSAPLSPTCSSIRAVYGPFHHTSPSGSNVTIVSTVLTSDSESTGAPLSPRSVGSMAVAGGSSRGTPRPTGHAIVGAASGAKLYQSQQHGAAAAAYTSSSGGGGASGAVVGRAPPHSGGSVSMSAATGGMVAAAAYASHLHQYQQQKQAQQQGGTSNLTNNLRPWLGPPPLTKSNSAPMSPHTTAQGALTTAGSSAASKRVPQSQSVPELYSLAHAPTPRHTATASVPIMFPKPVKALGTPKVLLADPLEPSPNMRISMVTLESQPDSTSSRTPSPSLMSLKSDLPLITPENAPPVPPLVNAGMSLPRSLHLTDVDGEGGEGDMESDSDRPLQRTHRPGPVPAKLDGSSPPEVLTLDEVADQIPVDARSIASSRISLVLPAPSVAATGTGASANHYVHPAATAAGSA